MGVLRGNKGTDRGRLGFGEGGESQGKKKSGRGNKKCDKGIVEGTVRRAKGKGRDNDELQGKRKGRRSSLVRRKYKGKVIA